MSLIPDENKIYFCEEGGSCFTCVGRENCTNYRYGSKFEDILKEVKNKLTIKE